MIFGGGSNIVFAECIQLGFVFGSGPVRIFWINIWVRIWFVRVRVHFSGLV